MTSPSSSAAPEVSWAELKAMILGYNEHFRESDRRLEALRAQNERELAATRAAIERELAEERKKTEAIERNLATARTQNERELAEERKKTEQSRRELDRRMAELGKQIAGLGDKFGYFAEGMALPSMERLLQERFGMETIAPRQRVRRHGREQEYDVIASANGSVNLVVVVEVKSRVRAEAIDQLIEQLETLPLMLPEYGQRPRIGILAGVDWDAGVREQAHAQGLYTAHIHDELFDLTTPEPFEPRRWGA